MTTILIPGKWQNKNELLTKLLCQKKYLLAGSILMDINTKVIFEIVLSENWSKDDYIAEFESPVSSSTEISLHANSVLIIEAHIGSFQKLMIICDAVSTMMEIGGLGVKIVTSGKTITREDWQKLSFSYKILFELFISVYPAENGILTCGMSNFNKRDIFVPLTFDADSVNLVLTFAWYVVNEQPLIQFEETFALSEDEPIFKIIEENDTRHPEHDYYNPHGLWELWPVNHIIADNVQ